MNINSTTDHATRRSVIALGFLRRQPDAPHITPEPPEWPNRAACRDHDRELFFPDTPGETIFAKRICQGCPVKNECLEWALEVEAGEPESYGVFGGMAARTRRRMIWKSRKAPAA